ncbi:MAG: TonB-dependent receptor [Bacteroidales bacterium]|nr:TonB-dependent receptor [Bacteroidales bacterium]
MNQIKNTAGNNIVHFKQWSNKNYGVFNSLKRQIKICALVVSYSILNLSNDAHAQTDTLASPKTYDLEEVDIFSTTPQQQLEQYGKSYITVISSSDIISAPASSLDEIIKYSPCLEAQSRNLFGVQSDFSIRGSTFNQVLVLVDGIPVNDPLTGHFSGNIPVPSSEIDRVEIIRGPWASKYGPSAMGGVINIVTKTFTSFDTPDFSSSGSFLGGEHKLFSTDAGFVIRDNNLSISGGVMRNSSDGEELPSGVANYFKISKYSLSSAYQISSDWKIANRIAWERSSFGAQYFYTYSLADTAEEKLARVWDHLQIKHIGEKSSTFLSVAFSQGRDSFSFYPGLIPNAHRTRIFQSTISHSYNFTKNLKLTFGLQCDQRSITSTDRGDHSDYHLGCYANSLFQPLSGLSMMAGFRADFDDNFGFEMLPQMSVEYVRNRFVYRASTGRSIRAGDYTERYTGYKLQVISPGRNVGNPALKAESSWGHEMGLDFNPVIGVLISGTGFLRYSKNLIDYVLTPESEIPNNYNLDSGGVYLYAKNISSITNSGCEFEIQIDKKIFKSSNILFTGGYVFVSSTNADSVISKYISGHAKHLFNGTVKYYNRYFMISLSSLIKERDTDFFEAIGIKHDKVIQVWNTRLDVNLYQNMVFANIQVKNIFDKTYYEVLGAKMPGRWILGGVVWKF